LVKQAPFRATNLRLVEPQTEGWASSLPKLP